MGGSSGVTTNENKLTMSEVQTSVTIGWGHRAGTYVETIEARVSDAKGNERELITIKVRITIPAAVDLDLVGPGAEGPIDLTPRADVERSSGEIMVHSDSTKPYILTFQGRGRMVDGTGANFIPYTLYFDNAPVDLTSGSSFRKFANHTPVDGDHRPLYITVPAMRPAAGSYSDQVTLTISVQ